MDEGAGFAGGEAIGCLPGMTSSAGTSQPIKTAARSERKSPVCAYPTPAHHFLQHDPAYQANAITITAAVKT